MSRNSIKFEYDRDVDAAYLKLLRGKVIESEEVKPGIIVDFGVQGEVLGVEILYFAKRFLSKFQASPQSTSRARPLKKSA